MKNIHRWGFAFIAIGIALWMSGVSHQLGSILFVIGLVGLVIAWVYTLDFELTHYLRFGARVNRQSPSLSR
jgi:1,4-dihydroxy-2-naphthoate octaprenyltransferase